MTKPLAQLLAYIALGGFGMVVLVTFLLTGGKFTSESTPSLLTILGFFVTIGGTVAVLLGQAATHDETKTLSHRLDGGLDAAIVQKVQEEMLRQAGALRTRKDDEVTQ